MKIITRYTLRQMVEPFFLALLAFTSVLLADKVFILTKYFVEKGVNPLYMVEMLFYYSPDALVLTVPMAFLVGVLTAFGRMAADNEIIAMKTAGVGMHRLIVPVIIVSFVLSVFMVFFMDFSLPEGNKAYTKLYVEVRRKHPALVLEPDTIMEELSGEGKKWYFKSMDAKTGELKDIRIWEQEANTPKLITAGEGELNIRDEYSTLSLHNGTIYQADKKEPLKNYAVGKFAGDEVFLDVTKSLNRDRRTALDPRNMSMKEVRDGFRKFEEELKSPATRPDVKEYIKDYLISEYLVEFYKKLAIPFASLAFGVIGVPLGLIVRRGGRMVGLGVGVGLIIIYYVLLTAGERLARANLYPPFLGAWTPDFLVISAGIMLIIRTVREAPIRSSRLLTKLFPPERGHETDAGMG